ncbi:MAG: hypothetical protein Q8M66_08130, partial [Actinomycetota bacterium]|nr:hypothetical protein [Actinomycetota bacterium]
MNHRIVSTVVMVIVALFVVAGGLFAWAAAIVAPLDSGAAPAPNNPHPADARTDACLDCHSVGQSSIPMTHRNYALQTCESCHRPALRVLVPHSVAMGDVRCPLCHGDPTRDFGIPASHLRYEAGECLLCHPVDPEQSYKNPRPAGLSRSYAAPIPHPAGGIFADCEYC